MVAKCLTVLVVLVAAVSLSEARAQSGSGVYGAGNHMKRLYPNGPDDLHNMETARFEPPPRVGLPPYPVVDDDLTVATRLQQPAVIASDDRWMLQDLHHKPVARPFSS